MRVVPPPLLAILLLAGACDGGRAGPEPADAQQWVARDAERGRQLIAEVGCGSCHTVPGVRGARGKVAAPLYFFSRRSFIAGQLPNNFDNLVRWLKNPPAVEPGTAMPALGLTDAQARDIAAYVETLE